MRRQTKVFLFGGSWGVIKLCEGRPLSIASAVVVVNRDSIIIINSQLCYTMVDDIPVACHVICHDVISSSIHAPTPTPTMNHDTQQDPEKRNRAVNPLYASTHALDIILL